MISISAETQSELLRDLSRLSRPVSERGCGQTTGETEFWHFAHLARPLVRAGSFDFPVKVLFADRPDVRLEMPSVSVGIELREVVPPAYAQADAIRNEYYPDAFIDRSLFSWGAQFTAKEIHAHLSRPCDEQLTGSPWHADEVERELAEAVNEAIAEKMRKLNEPGFSIYAQNWLSIYASSPGPKLDARRTAAYLAYPSAVPERHRFDTIFLLTGKALVILNEGAFELHDITQK